MGGLVTGVGAGRVGSDGVSGRCRVEPFVVVRVREGRVGSFRSGAVPGRVSRVRVRVRVGGGVGAGPVVG